MESCRDDVAAQSGSASQKPKWVPPLETFSAMTVAEFTRGRLSPGDDTGGTDTAS